MSGPITTKTYHNKRTLKGHGTLEKIDPRYLYYQRSPVEDETTNVEPCRTTVQTEKIRSIITTNHSPDLPFNQSINPYRGCEHGCIYCYARPTHAYLDLSPGIDFETRLFAKPDAARVLRQTLAKKTYECQPITLGANTDPYQPIERNWKITRSLIEVLHEFNHPLTIVTKSWMVERDIDLFTEMAEKNLVRVFISLTTLDGQLARIMEPRATAPQRRLETIRHLSDAGIQTGVLFAPVIPALNDHEMETILQAAADAGARYAGYVLLRLPLEVKPLFIDWLNWHMPDKAEHILSLIKQSRNGKLNDARFHARMQGKGPYANMIAQRFKKISRDLDFSGDGEPLNTDLYQSGENIEQQIPLFY